MARMGRWEKKDGLDGVRESEREERKETQGQIH